MTVEELNTFVRFWLGGIDEDVISDTNLNLIIQSVLDSGVAENDCQEKYYSLIETLRWLDRRHKMDIGDTTGPLSQRTEKVGNTSVSESYSNFDSNRDYYDDLLRDLQSNPTLIGCSPFENDNSDKTSNVVIGGADINGYDESYETRNRSQESAYNNKVPNGMFPWRPSGRTRKGYK